MDMNLMECALCGKPAICRYQSQEGYQKTLAFDVYHCEHCGTAFSHPLKSDASLYDLIYSQAEQVPGYKRYLKYADEVLHCDDPLGYLASQEEIYWAVAHALQWINPKNSRNNIIELGCGFGYLTYALRRANYSAEGLDISEVAVEKARVRYGPYYRCDEAIAFSKRYPEHYQTVVLTEVIEHVENVHDVLQAADRLLKPGGTLILTTPNRTAYPKDILWETELPPVHLWWFSEKSIQWMANSLGYAFSFVDFAHWNKEEYARYGVWQKPYLGVRGYRPSRLSRFGANYELLNSGDVIHEESSVVSEEKAARPTWRRTLKKAAESMGLLGVVDYLRRASEQWSIPDSIKLISPCQRRSTLCAILKKPK